MSAAPWTAPAARRQAPRWDGVRLWWAGRVIRHFDRLPTRQAPLLAALQARRWPADPLPDPFPPEPGDGPDDARRRLRQTVRNLNRELAPGTVRLRTNGTHVWWERARPRGRNRPR